MTLKTLFPSSTYYKPKWFLIDATNQTVGRLATRISNLLRGKATSYITPHINLKNFICIINANKVQITGKKNINKHYYKPTTRPGNLKSQTFNHLLKSNPIKILEKAIYGMLPKGTLGRQYFRQVYIYTDTKIFIN